MVESLCLDGARRRGRRRARPGPGKTFALGAAREAWQRAGHPVLGVAVARRPRRSSQEGAGIQSTSVAALLARPSERPGTSLPRRCRARRRRGRHGRDPAARRAARARRGREGKLVLVGDHRQLPEIEAGGAFRALVARGCRHRATENVRQAAAWERRALGAAARRRPGARRCGCTKDHERVVPSPRARQRRYGRHLVADWWASRDNDGALMIAFRRADVADLNGRARALGRAGGGLGDDELAAARRGRSRSAIVCCCVATTRRLGVANGDRATRSPPLTPPQGHLTVDIHGRRVALDRR